MDATIFWSLLTFCLGLILGHRLQLLRERRKEFNEAADPVRSALLSARGSGRPARVDATPVEWEILREHQPLWKRKAFDRAQAAHVASHKAYVVTRGTVTYHADPVNEAIEGLLPFVKRK